MMRVNLLLSCLFLISIWLLNACSEQFLDIKPNGVLDGNVLATEEGVETLLIGAYSMLDGVADQGFGWEAAGSNWLYGSIRGMEANKGSDAGDQSDINAIQAYSETATNSYLNARWRSLYEGIARANQAMQTLSLALAEGKMSEEQAIPIRNQIRALRGHYHLEAYKMWEMIPYVDENTDPVSVSNTPDIRANIIADLEAGTNLPLDMGQVGRFNKTVSQVLLAKAHMQLWGDFLTAKTLLEEVIATGTKADGTEIGLEPLYGDIFDAANRNGLEAIYTVQYSVNDGSGGYNGGFGEVLNFPYKGGASPGGCCGFFQPNPSFVNAFRTENGLPLLDGTYYDQPVRNDQGITVEDSSYVEDSGPLDPRLDWTVGRRGIPYLDWGDHTGQDWIRDQAYGGPYSPKKQVYMKSQEGELTETGNWTSGWTANGYRMIRYADVLLLLAECEIETGDLSGALSHVNAVRERAANPDGFVKEADGSTPAANYEIGLYPDFPDVAYARRALWMERRLELGMEGHRFFDLKRWDRTSEEINRALVYEATLRPSQYAGVTFERENIHYLIPQRQIDLSNGNLVQNR